MTCRQCQTASARPHSGAYNFACVQCCARLVLSTHPNKQQAGVMLAAIARFDGAPSRKSVLLCVEQLRGKHLLAQQKSNTASVSG